METEPDRPTERPDDPATIIARLQQQVVTLNANSILQGRAVRGLEAKNASLRKDLGRELGSQQAGLALQRAGVNGIEAVNELNVDMARGLVDENSALKLQIAELRLSEAGARQKAAYAEARADERADQAILDARQKQTQAEAEAESAKAERYKTWDEKIEALELSDRKIADAHKTAMGFRNTSLLLSQSNDQAQAAAVQAQQEKLEALGRAQQAEAEIGVLKTAEEAAILEEVRRRVETLKKTYERDQASLAVERQQLQTSEAVARRELEQLRTTHTTDAALQTEKEAERLAKEGALVKVAELTTRLQEAEEIIAKRDLELEEERSRLVVPLSEVEILQAEIERLQGVERTKEELLEERHTSIATKRDLKRAINLADNLRRALDNAKGKKGKSGNFLSNFFGR